VIAAAGLAAWAALLLAAGAPALARAPWPDRAPRLAIIAWLALAGSAVASVALGGAALLVPAARVSADLARLLAACVILLRADYAHPGGAVLTWAGAAIAAAVTGRLAWCGAAALLAEATAGHRHRHRLRLVGRPDRRLGAIVVDHHAPAAYCLPGPRRPAGIPAAAFGPVPAFRLARDQVARLAELAADDDAAAASPRLALAEALLTLAAAPAGAAALGAGGATAARIHRMIAAPDPLSRTAVTVWTLAVAALVALPFIAAASPALLAMVETWCCHPGLAGLVPPPGAR
jgi:hypothetical protein